MSSLRLPHVPLAVAVALGALTLTACGAGSTIATPGPVPTESRPAPTATPTATPTLAPTPTAAPTSTPPPVALHIVSGSPPSGTAGIAYGSPHTLWQCVFTSIRCDWVPGGRWVGFTLASGGDAGANCTAHAIRPCPFWSWAAAAGSALPPGLNLSNPALFSVFDRRDCIAGLCGYTPAIVGMPTMAGTYNVIVTVTGKGSPPPQASANYTIVIAP